MVVMSILALLNNLFLRNPFESIWRTSTYIVISGIGLWLFQYVQVKGYGVWVNYLFLISMGTLPIYGSEVLAALFDFKQNFFAASFITPVPIAVIIVLSLLKLTQKDRRFLLNLLQQKEGEIFKQTAQGLDAEKRQLASYLHNSFQSELLSLSSQLAAAAVSKDKDQTASILQRVSAVAQRSLTDDLSRMNQEPLERLNEVIESWKNLLQIELHVPQEVLIRKLNSHVFLQTVEEVSSNAYRHDKATKVTITSEPGEIGTRIFFQSNGVQPISKSKGMGSNWLNQVSLKPWSIEKNEAGTLITLEL
jgi:signal transduction histidine kinase